MIHRQKQKETDCRSSAPFSWVSLGVPSTPSSPCPLCIPYSVTAVGMNIDLACTGSLRTANVLALLTTLAY